MRLFPVLCLQAQGTKIAPNEAALSRSGPRRNMVFPTRGCGATRVACAFRAAAATCRFTHARKPVAPPRFLISKNFAVNCPKPGTKRHSSTKQENGAKDVACRTAGRRNEPVVRGQNLHFYISTHTAALLQLFREAAGRGLH